MAVTDLTGTKWRFVGENVGSSVTNFPKGETQTEDSLPSTSDFNSTKGYNLVLSATDLLTNTDFVNETGYLIAVWDNDIGDNIGIYFGNASHIYKVAGVNDSHASYNIEITGGTDVTNSDLISWLQANATQITEPSNPISIGNLPIANMYFGTQQVKKVYLGNALVWEKEESVGCEVTLQGAGGTGNEYVYIQINDDPTWYYAQMLIDGGGFSVLDTNIPNAYVVSQPTSIGVSNISKIKIGTKGNPANYTGPKYISGDATGDFVGLTFTSTGGSDPAYATGEITMTQDSLICFEGND